MAKSKEQPPRNTDDGEEESLGAARGGGKQYPKTKERRAARETKRSIGAPVEAPVVAKEEIPAAEKKEAPADETVPSETGPFDTTAFVRGVESSYLRLGENIRRHGIDPRDLPDEVWESANKTFGTIKTLSEEYRKESSPEARANISARIQRMGVSLDGSIKKKIETTTKALLKERKEARTSPDEIARKEAMERAELLKKMRETAGIKPEVAAEESSKQETPAAELTP